MSFGVSQNLILFPFWEGNLKITGEKQIPFTTQMSKNVTSLHSQSCLQLEQGICVKLSKPNGSATDFKERAQVIQSRFGRESILVAITGTAVTSAFRTKSADSASDGWYLCPVLWNRKYKLQYPILNGGGHLL